MLLKVLLIVGPSILSSKRNSSCSLQKGDKRCCPLSLPGKLGITKWSHQYSYGKDKKNWILHRIKETRHLKKMKRGSPAGVSPLASL